MKGKRGLNQKVIPIRAGQDRYHRVRVTANPNDSRTVDVVESLLSKCELARCESSTEESASTWSLVVRKELLDEALDGIAITIPIDYELFRDEEGRQYLVTSKEWFRLGGIAEDTATCWEDDDLEDFETEVSQILKNLFQNEIGKLPWPGDGAGDEIFGKIEDQVMLEMDVFTWTEEDVHESVQAAYKEAKETINSAEE